MKLFSLSFSVDTYAGQKYIKQKILQKIRQFFQTMAEKTEKKQFLHDILEMRFFTEKCGTVRAEMEVKEKVCQPFGLLNGGASLALAETLAGYASLSLCPENAVPVGVQVSANHLNSAFLGETVVAEAALLKQDETFHCWEITIRTKENGKKLISVCQVTNYIIKKPQKDKI